MTVLTTDRLLDVEASLDRSFLVTGVLFVLSLLWPVFLRATTLDGQSWAGVSVVIGFLVVFASYIWFAIASMNAAACVQRSKWLVGAWVLLAPFVAAALLIPIVASLVTVIFRGKISAPALAIVVAVSPLSLKFILASELRDEIHDKTFVE